MIVCECMYHFFFLSAFRFVFFLIFFSPIFSVYTSALYNTVFRPLHRAGKIISSSYIYVTNSRLDFTNSPPFNVLN